MATFLFGLLALIAIPQFPLLCVSGRKLTEAEKRNALDAHNYYRRLIANEWTAGDMRVMVWNNELEKFANKWTTQCAHSSPTNQRWNVGGEGSMGENTWVSRLNGPPFNITHVVRTWYNEGDNLDRITESLCRQPCLGFRQLAWAESYKVGCAVSEIDGCTFRGLIGIKETVFICDYAPGAKEWLMWHAWKSGFPCSCCEGEWKKFCIDGLCSKSCQPKTEPEFQAMLASGAQKTTAHVVFAVILLAITHSLCTV